MSIFFKEVFVFIQSVVFSFAYFINNTQRQITDFKNYINLSGEISPNRRVLINEVFCLSFNECGNQIRVQVGQPAL